MAAIVKHDSSLPIYRFKFSDSFMDLLRTFANNHRYDEPAVFKERWLRWSCNEINIKHIVNEEKRLVDSGYKGDMEDKMFKTVRYYLKNKSVEKKEPKKRRKYISISKYIIESMDEHIEEIAMIQNMKPAMAYNNYSSNDEYSDSMDDELNRLINLGMNDISALNKIKKTYKNRYYLQQKN